ncbi:hypothetical protein [Curtobacterium luteum]|uniref:hypothetical protein n=1 Tax=Curtobacterium luteum TaxID=33881 RepID=UPI00381DE221
MQYRVGHGGFHSTVVHNDSGGTLTYIYDVGAYPDVGLLGGAIDAFVSELQSASIRIVDYIFISHIDEDHVNRLPKLIAKLRNAGITVTTLVLPWLSGVSKLFALMGLKDRSTGAIAAELLQSDDSVMQVAADLGFSGVTFVRGDVEGASDDVDALAPIQSAFDEHGNEVPATVVPSGYDVNQSATPWRLTVSQLGLPADIYAEFSSILRGKTTLDPEKEAGRRKLVATKAERAKVAAAMRETGEALDIPRAHVTITNWSSLSLFSTSTSAANRHPVPQATGVGFGHTCEDPWVHTGDLPLDVDRVWRAFEAVWDGAQVVGPVCAVMAPHHGSQHGHNIELYQRFDPTVTIFTFGLNAGTTRTDIKWSKLLNPRPVMKSVRGLGASKLRLLNNRSIAP